MPGNPIEFGLGYNLSPLEQGGAAAKRLVAQTMGNIQQTAASGAARAGNAFKSLASPILALLPAIAAAFTGRAIAAGVGAVFAYGRALQVASRQTGASVRDLALLNAQFKAAGGDAEDVVPAISKVQKALAGVDEEGTNAPAKLRALGVNLAALQNASPGQQLLIIGRAIAAIQDPTERTNAAIAIFGRSGAKLNAVFAGDFGKFSAGQVAKADALARNAAAYEKASILLARAGNILKTFYAGTAEGLVSGLIPILQAVNKIDLTKAGRQFGSMLSAVGGQLFETVLAAVGLLKDPTAIFGLWINAAHAFYGTIGNGLAAVGRWLAQYFGNAGGVLLTSLQTAFVAVGGLVGGIGDKFQGMMMQGPLKAVQVLAAGFDFVTDTLPQKLVAALSQGMTYLRAGLDYAAEFFGSGLTKRLLASALQFSTALASPAVLVAEMLKKAPATGKEAFQKSLAAARASGEFAVNNAPNPGNFGDYLTNAASSILGGAGGMAARGDALSRQGDARIQAALAGLAGVAGKLPGELGNALSTLPKFEFRDVTGAGAAAGRFLQSRADLAATGRAVLGLPRAGGRGTGGVGDGSLPFSYQSGSTQPSIFRNIGGDNRGFGISNGLTGNQVGSYNPNGGLTTGGLTGGGYARIAFGDAERKRRQDRDRGNDDPSKHLAAIAKNTESQATSAAESLKIWKGK